MAKQYSQEELEERYRKLPEELQGAMYSFDIADKIFETGKKYNLSTEKIGILAEEIGYIMLGLSSPREFIQELINSLGIDEKRTKDVASEINRELFSPLRGMLKRTHGVEFTEEDIQHGGEEMIRKTAPTTGAAPIREQESTSKPTFPGITPPPRTSPIDLREQELQRSAPVPKLEEKKPEIPTPPTLITKTWPEQTRPQPSNTTSAVPANRDKTNVADVDILGKPSWILPKPSMPEPEAKKQETGVRTEPKIELAPTPTQTQLKKEESGLIPPAPRTGPRIPPIDLRGRESGIRNQEAGIQKQETGMQPEPEMPTITPPQQKPAPQPYKNADPYKEPLE